MDGCTGTAYGRPMKTTRTRNSPRITERQRQVIRLIATGCSNQEISAILGISPRTAKAHCDTLRQKLGVSKRRYLPIAYLRLTGDDPLAPRDVRRPAEPEATS